MLQVDNDTSQKMTSFFLSDLSEWVSTSLPQTLLTHPQFNIFGLRAFIKADSVIVFAEYSSLGLSDFDGNSSSNFHDRPRLMNKLVGVSDSLEDTMGFDDNIENRLPYEFKSVSYQSC